MTNGTGGPNLYTIDTCSEGRTGLEISTGGNRDSHHTAMFSRCSARAGGQRHSFGHDIFFHGACCVVPSRRVASVKSLSLSCIYAILDSKRLRPGKLIRYLPLQLKTHFGSVHTKAGALGMPRPHDKRPKCNQRDYTLGVSPGLAPKCFFF